MSRTYCVDMDDLVDGVMLQHWRDKPTLLVDFLAKWEEATPGIKVTFFTIPQRVSDATIRIFKINFPWIKLAPHGWRHSRGECLGWTSEEAVEKLKAAKDRGIDAPVFRAPGWLLDGETYEACGEMGYTVASHATYHIPHPTVRQYIYNRHDGVEPMRTRRVHGHLTPVSGNHIFDLHADGWLNFKKGDSFVYPWEVSKVITQ